MRTMTVAALCLATTPALAGEGVTMFPLSDVRLLPGPFAHAQEVNRRMVLAHDPDRLLAPFREEAGLAPRAPKYPNWESSGLGGHTAGHYLTALAQLWAAGDAEAKRRLDAMAAELLECQRANGDGYVGGVPGGRELWAQVAAGRLDVDGFGLNGKWVPWYNLHKLFAGLRDAWVLAGSATARDVLVGLADWCERTLSRLSDGQVQEMLRAEHGGMNEVLADVAAITGDKRYLALARRFSHRALLDPLLRSEDPLTGLHANTQIPKVVGFARIAELGDEPAWSDAAAFFWDVVVRERSVAFGGNSVREHFPPSGDFRPAIESREGPESCNTYNMIRLTEQLFRLSPRAAYADFYERAIYNHVLSTQHPEHGGYVYFTPIRPRHYRVYSRPGSCFWCCVGSGMESHGKYGRFVYARGPDAVYVNLFVPSELTWREHGLSVVQETRFPEEERTRLRFAASAPLKLTLHVRHPAWAERLALRVNGKPWPTSSTPSSYAAVTRTWRGGDEVEVELPMRTTVEPLPGTDYAAVLHGPIVLAAGTGTESLDGLIADDSRMGHAAPGPYLPLDGAPMLVGDAAMLAGLIRPVPGQPLTFTAPDLIRPVERRDLELVPFFRVHDARYVVYWRVVSPERYAELAAARAAAEKERADLDARTVDRVLPGEAASETTHRFEGEDAGTGVHLGSRWRDAASSFGYRLRAPDGPLELVVTYFGGDQRRRFDVLVGDRVLAKVRLDGREPDRFVDAVYPVPEDVPREDGSLHVRFVGRDGSRAGPLHGLRLVRRR